MFKKIIYSLVAVSFMTCATSCNDWLDIKPNNELITDDYWQSKEDVESVVMSGYYYMRQCVPTLIKWGELRGGTFYATSGQEAKVQDFNVLPSSGLVDYSNIYKVINAANSVLKYAPGICDIDDTYHVSMMNAHLCEAYFMRAYCYLILVKNYGSVPMVLEPYVDDNASFDLAKSSEAEIIAQIKADVISAIDTGAAKTTYEVDWETKGRVTKWALYALMADASLWAEDYATCKHYCDLILNATDTFRPVFMSIGAQWYDMFAYGNSNESIFELNWDINSTENTGNNFNSLWTDDLNSSPLRFTTQAVQKLKDEIQRAIDLGASIEGRVGRMLLGTCANLGGNAAWSTANNFRMWKYAGTEIPDPDGGKRQNQDANFIIYRVSEIMLMQAQAETMTGNIPEALKLVNRIRNRAGIGNFEDIDENDAAVVSSIDEKTMIDEVLHQKEMEFMGEGKRWYDVLWYGRVANNRYREYFEQTILQGNMTTNPSWISSVLTDENSWYLPLPQSDIEHNSLLVQNPYYSSSSK